MIDDLRAKEAVIKLDLAENRVDKVEGEAVINFIGYFTSNVGGFWEKLIYAKKQRLQSRIFPEGVYYNDGNFGTSKIASSFKLIKGLARGKESLVTPPGFEPGFLG